MNDLETQLNAARGFAEWLKTEHPAPNEEEQELCEQLLHVLEIYQLELERQIECSRANDDWFGVIALVSLTAALLKDGLIEANPDLAHYAPADEPLTADEMKIKLLSDALTLFHQAQDDLSAYLDRPTFPDALNQLLHTVQQSVANE